jgi:hypothetical protein
MSIRVVRFEGRNLALAIALVSRWVCAAMACAKCAGLSGENLFKNAKGRLYYFLVCPYFIFFKVQVVSEAVHLSPWEVFVSSLVVRCFLKPKFVRALLLPTSPARRRCCLSKNSQYKQWCLGDVRA